jgi:hypothetical protein
MLNSPRVVITGGLLLAAVLHPLLLAQTHVPEPAVNLGDTSFLDGVGGPGWLVETIGDGYHAGGVKDSSGADIPSSGAVNSISDLTHIAWLSHAKLFGGWYGSAVVLAAAHVNAGDGGSSGGLGDLTISPFLLQWPEQKLGHLRIQQRADFDIDLPTGAYSQQSSLNIGANNVRLEPYYAVTAYPSKRIETSWRVHYLWNSANTSPAYSTGAQSTQAGQAVHFNATLSYNLRKPLWIGLNSYYLDQITDGKVNGVAISRSPEQVGAIGPGILWNQNANWHWYADAYQEFGAKNRPEGHKLVLRIERTF